MKIVVENSDCQIWHKTQVITDIIQAATSAENITVSLNYEGPCAERLGLYELLDFLCNKFNINPDRISIETFNQIETHPVYNIVKRPPTKGIAQLQNQLRNNPAGYKTINNTTKHFGSFVGHGNRIRLALSSHLYHYHSDKTLQSYHTDIKNPYFNRFIGLEQMLFDDYTQSQIDRAYNFLKSTPLKLDNIVSYPILHEKNVYDILDYYPGIFVDIVNQTYFTGNTFYLDDKFWRSIITKTPFVVQGPSNFVLNLRKLGFKTFDRWWNEGYSEDPPDCQAQAIMAIIDTIAAWDTATLDRVYNEMKPVLDHNYELFMNLTAQDFRRVFNYTTIQ